MSKKMVRWSLAMSRFDYNVVYRKGKANVSDALSRLEPTTMPVMEQKSLKQRIIGEQKNDAECRAAVEFLKCGKMMVDSAVLKWKQCVNMHWWMRMIYFCGIDGMTKGDRDTSIGCLCQRS